MVKSGALDHQGGALLMISHSQITRGPVSGNNYATDHVLFLLPPLHNLGLAQRDPLILGCHASLPFPKFLLALHQEHLSSQKEEGKQGEAVDRHGFSLVGTCLTKAGKSVPGCSSVMQGCRMTLPLL